MAEEKKEQVKLQKKCYNNFIKQQTAEVLSVS